MWNAVFFKVLLLNPYLFCISGMRSVASSVYNYVVKINVYSRILLEINALIVSGITPTNLVVDEIYDPDFTGSIFLSYQISRCFAKCSFPVFIVSVFSTVMPMIVLSKLYYRNIFRK